MFISHTRELTLNNNQRFPSEQIIRERRILVTHDVHHKTGNPYILGQICVYIKFIDVLRLFISFFISLINYVKLLTVVEL